MVAGLRWLAERFIVTGFIFDYVYMCMPVYRYASLVTGAQRGKESVIGNLKV